MGQIFCNTKNGGLGEIARDCQGHVIGALSEWLDGSIEVDCVEALRLLELCVLPRSWDYIRSSLEGDSLGVITEIQKEVASLSATGHIPQGIVEIGHFFRQLDVMHVGWDVNKIANHLA